jgi:[ribosomal protein S5]-alanine N-acetyltransferase
MRSTLFCLTHPSPVLCTLAAFDEEKRREWLTWLVQEASTPHRDTYNWAITLRSNRLLIGWLILGRSRHARDPGMPECGCGYALNRHYWRQDYMPEALQAACTYAFTVLLTRLIHAECERENTASARVMQKCGMEYEGTMYDDDGLGNWAHRDRYVITAES